LADLYSKKAIFEDVKLVEDALQFHYERYSNTGAKDTLARQCFQYVMQRETVKQMKANRTVYEYWKEEVDGKDSGS
jgi:hypothetical protein